MPGQPFHPFLEKQTSSLHYSIRSRGWLYHVQFLLGSLFTASKDNVSFQVIYKRNNLKRITHDTTWTTTLGLPVLFRCIIPLSNGKMIGTLSPSSPSCVQLTTDRSCLGPSFCPIPQNPGSSCCLFLVSVSLEVYCRAACS